MTEIEFLNHVHRLLGNECTANPHNTNLRSLQLECWDRLKSLGMRQGRPMVFKMETPGYVTLGVLGHEQTLRHPGLDGLDHAWRIFLEGVTVADTVNAADLIGDVVHPGNALRNLLAKAAAWVEKFGECPELARAMRSPVMSIAMDGTISYQPNLHPAIDLGR